MKCGKGRATRGPRPGSFYPFAAKDPLQAGGREKGAKPWNLGGHSLAHVRNVVRS